MAAVVALFIMNYIGSDF